MPKDYKSLAANDVDAYNSLMEEFDDLPPTSKEPEAPHLGDVRAMMETPAYFTDWDMSFMRSIESWLARGINQKLSSKQLAVVMKLKAKWLERNNAND